jgi:hypothetical protein
MTNHLITIETFENVMHARLVQNYLEGAGIRSVLSDEFMVSNFWHLSNAVGGIKLQVAEENFEQACDLLDDIENRHRSQSPEPDDASSDEANTTAGNETDANHSADISPKKPNAADEGDEDDEPPLNAREENVERALRTTIISYIMPPVLFYAAWVLMDVWQSDLPLRPAIRRKLYRTIGLLLPITVIVIVATSAFGFITTCALLWP